MPMGAGEEWDRDVAARYASEARDYRDLWAPLLLPHGRELLAALPLARAARVLDVGSGCGTLLRSIRISAPSALVVGIDRTAAMLALAPVEFPRAVMDASGLGLATATFDLAVAAFVLFHVRDPMKALAELRRVLRRGAAIGATTWEGDPCFPAQRAWLEELDAHPAAPPVPAVSDHEPWSSPERMRRLLEGAGFGSVRAWTRPFGHAYTPEQFILMRTRLGTSRRRLEAMDAEAREGLLRRARERLGRFSARDFVDDTGILFVTAEAC